MEPSTFLSTIREGITNNAGVKAIYGEPISAEGKTVIPVARIVYGFGGGSGTRGSSQSPESGGGGGGGVVAVPVGVVEVTPDRTRFVPLVSRGKLAAAGAAGLLAGMLIGRRRRR